jgi:hypothetical protein
MRPETQALNFMRPQVPSSLRVDETLTRIRFSLSGPGKLLTNPPVLYHRVPLDEPCNQHGLVVNLARAFPKITHREPPSV